MIPGGVILEELSAQTNDPRNTQDQDWKNKLLIKLNEAYREVAASYTWTELKKTATLTDDSYIVPADCMRILRVIDENDQQYNYIGGPKHYSDYNYNWYFNTPVATVLASGTTLYVNDYDTAVVSTAEFPATTCVNEYIRIGSNAGLYKISTWTSTSAITLTDYYRGKSESDATFSIRPIGTPILGFTDASADDIAANGIVITYQKMPLPLSRDEDIIELPGDCGAVRIKALQKVLALLKRDWEATRMQEEYIAALGRMKALSPQVPIMRTHSMFKRRTLSGTNTLHDRLIYS